MTCHKRVTFAKSAKYDYFCILPLFCTEFHTFYINNESTQWYMSTQVDFRQGAHSFFFLCYVIPNIYIRIKPLVWHSEDKHEAKTHTHTLNSFAWCLIIASTSIILQEDIVPIVVFVHLFWYIGTTGGRGGEVSDCRSMWSLYVSFMAKPLRDLSAFICFLYWAHSHRYKYKIHI